MLHLAADDDGFGTAEELPTVERAVVALGLETPRIDRPFDVGVDDRDIRMIADAERTTLREA